MELVATHRTVFGKSIKTMRKDGNIPGELYGRGKENVHVSVEAKAFEKVLREAGENSIVTLVVAEKKTPVLIHEVSRDYLTLRPIHVDFYAVTMDQKVKVHIPIVFEGDAPAVKEKGGVLNKLMSEIEVEVLPGDMPHSFEVDLTVLDEIGKSIHLSDVRANEKVKFVLDGDAVIATVVLPQEEKEEVVMSVEDVKVETEEKKADRAKDEAEAEKTGIKSGE